jgi:hypothetical protein
MIIRCLLLLAAVSAIFGESATAGGQAQPIKVTRQQFGQLRWIDGQWRGSGGAYPSFFEEYRFLNDSTIRMRAFSDSTFRTVTDSSTIALRNGTIQSGSGRLAYDVIEFSPTRVRFARRGATGGGHTFARNSANEWTATLHPSAPGGQATIYRMRRIAR